MEAGAAENRAMLNGMNPFNLGMRAADHAGITPVQMQAADDPDPTVYKAALVELLVAADRSSTYIHVYYRAVPRSYYDPLEPTALALY